MTGELAHVRPEPIEAPEPHPERVRDRVFDLAAILGFEQMRAASSGPSSLEDFRAGFRIALDYVLLHDRRVGRSTLLPPRGTGR